MRKIGKEKPKKKTKSQRQEDRERANLGLSAAGLGISTVGLAISIIALMNRRPGRRGFDDGDYEVLMSESRGPVYRER